MSHCGHCGSPLKPNARFCGKCGFARATAEGQGNFFPGQPVKGPPPVKRRPLPSLNEALSHAAAALFLSLLALNGFGIRPFRHTLHSLPLRHGEIQAPVRMEDGSEGAVRLNDRFFILDARGGGLRAPLEEIDSISFLPGTGLRADRLKVVTADGTRDVCLPLAGAAFRDALELRVLAARSDPGKTGPGLPAPRGAGAGNSRERDPAELFRKFKEAQEKAERVGAGRKGPSPPPIPRDDARKTLELYKVIELVQAEDFAKAQGSIELILNSFPDWAEALLLKGQIEKALGNHRDAERTLRRVVALSPEDHRPLAELGELEKDRRNWTDAAGWLRKALALDPYDWTARIDLLQILTDRLESYDEAESVRKGLAQSCGNPCDNSWIAFFLEAFRGQILMMKDRDMEGAFAAYEKAFRGIEKRDDSPFGAAGLKGGEGRRLTEFYKVSLLRYAETAFELKKWETAETRYRRAISIRVHPEFAMEKLAALLYEQGRHQETAELAEKLVENDPTREWPYLILISSLDRLGEKARARLWLGKAKVMVPNSEKLKALEDRIGAP